MQSSSFSVDDVVDVNVYLFRWPFRRIEGDEPDELVRMLRAQGVTQAWAGSFEGVFAKDVAAVNQRLADACSRHDMLVPFGSVNPRLPNWQEDVRRIHEVHGMAGIRVHPGYHNYALHAPEFAMLVAEAAERGLLVQVVPWMQDERHHNPLMPVPTPDLDPLVALVEKLPQLRVVVLNSFRSPQDPLNALTETGRVWVDIAKLDVIDPLTAMLQQASLNRVLFGSYAPMFHYESTLLKLQESAMSEHQINAICRENARKLLKMA